MIRRTFMKFIAAAAFLTVLTACGSARTDAPSQPEVAAPTAPAGSANSSDTPAAPTSAPASSGSNEAGAIPLFPEAKPLESGSPLATVVDSMKQQIAQQQANAADVTVDAYTLPAGASFDKVKGFYGDSLKGDGWSEVSSGQQNAAGLPGGGSATWLKNDKDVVTIVVMPDPMQSSNAILFLAHATAK